MPLKRNPPQVRFVIGVESSSFHHPLVQALGCFECSFFSITAMLADVAIQTADVVLHSFEVTGGDSLLVKLLGNHAQVEVALAAVQKNSNLLGAGAITHIIARPSDSLQPLLDFPNSINALYGGPDLWLPQKNQSTSRKLMQKSTQAIGILETQGLTAILEATDAMLKAADVRLVGKEKIGAAYVTVIITGDVAAVTAAIDAGKLAVGTLGKCIAGHVIARPHEDLIALLPK